ncbi:lipase family protein [Aureispira anguillae]|uniref:Lipase family protein n=1 Tax=Aureispira anguillae TaxID=2864201 RepID=A0A915VJX8_9BACT|nr:lipase family protein [Aureispira anguillae]BDS09411.1 lipase family protein [Aureispira anguillae]
MRFFIFVLLFGINSNVWAQLREGFDPDEVKALIAMCNSYTFNNLYGSDASITPKAYKKIFSSPTIGMDNKFQVYTKEKIGVINFRGSTDQISSWIENMYSAMIPAKGVMLLNKKEEAYCFAQDSAAAVHSGYALAVVLLSSTIINQIQQLNQQGIYDILITGHSQGGALANMTRAYLENLPKNKLSSKNVYKTYAFANPMCGNKAFSEEYHLRYCENNMSYSIINPADLVPFMPMHYQEKGKILSKERLKSWIFGKESFDIRKLGMELVIRKFEKNLKDYVNASNRLLEKMVSASYGSVDMPDYVRDINYYQVGNIRELEQFAYPKIILDPEQLTEKQRSKIKPAEDGNYYQQEPNFYQHKPYNYYVAILKEYFSRDYKNLTVKYLPENL